MKANQNGTTNARASRSGRPRIPLADRIWSKVEKAGSCWLWTGYIQGGYGMVKESGGRRVLAHRAVYEILTGKIPEGLQLDHLCRVRHCVNPGHLEPVTQKENILRGISFSARNAAKSECPRGHSYDAANTRRDKYGKRHCRTCHHINETARRARLKAVAS